MTIKDRLISCQVILIFPLKSSIKTIISVRTFYLWVILGTTNSLKTFTIIIWLTHDCYNIQIINDLYIVLNNKKIHSNSNPLNIFENYFIVFYQLYIPWLIIILNLIDVSFFSPRPCRNWSCVRIIRIRNLDFIAKSLTPLGFTFHKRKNRDLESGFYISSFSIEKKGLLMAWYIIYHSVLSLD